MTSKVPIKIQMLSATTATSKDAAADRNIGIIDKYHLRPICLHIGLIVTCIGYAVFGAILFKSIERPIELEKRKKALIEFDTLQQQFVGNVSIGGDANRALEIYTRKLMKMFEDPHYSHTFGAYYASEKNDKDMWTFESALIFTTTTVIPVGYGYISPASDFGKALLVIYALLGIPLTLVTMADTGKFVSQLVSRWFGESIAVPAVFFVVLLFAYPIVVGYLLHITSDMLLLDSVYFTLTSIFTIGFGDLTPDMNVIHLVLFIAVGVILVTITVDFVAVELIDHVHYMGRHVGKAKELAGKMFQLAQSINMKNGIANGVSQLHILARFGMMGGREDVQVTEVENVAFSPALMERLRFVDSLSIYSQRGRYSPDNSARNFFIS